MFLLKRNFIHIILGFLSFLCLDTFGQHNADSLQYIIGKVNIDSLIESLSSKTGLKRYETLSQIATHFLLTDGEKAVKYAEEALKIAIEFKDERKIALSHIDIGMGEYQRNNYQAALKELEIAEEIETKLNNENLIIKIKNEKAVVYTAMKRYDIALELLNQIMAFNYEKGLKSSYAFTLFNISNIFLEKKDYDKALEGYLKVLEINKNDKSPNKELTAAIYSNIGEIYYDKGQYKLAYKYRKTSLDLYKEINFQNQIANSEMDIGLTLIKLKNYSLSTQYLSSALKQSKSINFSEGIRTALEYFTILYLETNRYPAALNSCNELESLSVSDKDSSDLVKCYKMYADIYFKTGNYKPSAEYFQKYIELNDIIDSRENKQKFLELESNYLIEEKDFENKVLRKENELQKETLSSENKLILVISAGVIIALVLLIMLMIQRKKIKIQNRKLKEAIVSMDKFFSIISHDLRSPFLGLEGLTKTMAEDIDSFSKDELSALSKEMNKSVNNLMRMITNLLDWARTKQGEFSYNPKEIELNEKVSENLALINKLIEQKGIEFVVEIPSELFVYADEEMLNSILRNLLTNAVKFTSKNGKVIVNAKGADNNFVEIAVTDNGIGMADDLCRKLFRIEEKVGRKGTEGEESTGMGLLVCKEFVEKNGGKIWVESKEGTGSTFYFIVPKAR
jgi:signal transduction histidine kinase